MYTSVTLPISLGTKNNGQSKSFLTRFHVSGICLVGDFLMDSIPCFTTIKGRKFFELFPSIQAVWQVWVFCTLVEHQKDGWKMMAIYRVKNLVQKCHEMAGNKASPSSFSSKCPKLGGGFKHFLCSSLFEEMIKFDEYFSDGLKPPTRTCPKDHVKFH